MTWKKCDIRGISLGRVGRAGGVGFWWYDITVKVISYNQQHVLVEVLDKMGDFHLMHNWGLWLARQF